MSLFQKLGEAISANVNNAIDKASNPSVMAEYYIAKAEKELDETRKEVASIMADKLALERNLKEAEEGVRKMQLCAEEAVKAGNKEDARAALEKKAQFTERVERLKSSIEIATNNEKKMSELYDSQSKELERIKEEASTIKANMAIANTQRKLNDYSSETNGKAKSQFKKAQEKAARMVDEANCEATIAERDMSAEALADKYVPKTSVDEELAALEEKFTK